MDNTTPKEGFDEQRRFDDRPRRRSAAGAGPYDERHRALRADCWGSIAGTKEPAGDWRRIECLACSRFVNGEDAAREADAMRREADDNMAAARIGRPANCRTIAAAWKATSRISPKWLGHSRETFGKWRYFEQGIREGAIRALVDTDRVWGLGKAARVIADECVIAGLNYKIDIDTTFEFELNAGDMRTSQLVHLALEGGESSVHWDEVLRSGTDGG